MSRSCNECVKGLFDILNLWCQKRNLIVTVVNFFNTHLDPIICISHIVYGGAPS